ncbi:MAG: hypothetical protein H7061_04740 [Bdellovibrionaceae bacterium]|nr:hypothetical protein [Bdellovibrio sp.]
MKSFLASALIVCFSVASVAQSLEVTGQFKRKDVEVRGDIKSKKACARAGGRLTQHGCAMSSGTSSVSIQRSSTGNYSVAIQSVDARGEGCEYVGEAEMMSNGVQLMAKQGECEMTIGFQNHKTLSVMVNDAMNCHLDLLCSANGDIRINDLTRVTSQSKK